MSNLIFSGYSFVNDLLARWYLQNTVSLNPSETQEMALQLLDYLGNGFEITTQTPYGKNPDLVLRSLLQGSKTDLLSFDGSRSLLKTKVPLDMGGQPIQNLADPLDNQDAATKNFVLSQLNTGGGFSHITSLYSSGTWTVPSSITKIKLTLIGGGGGGASVNADNSIGATGGGGGATSISYKTVTPGDILTIMIGVGGAGGLDSGLNSGGTGGETRVTGDGWYVSAVGGVGGRASSLPGGMRGGAGGASDNSRGDFRISGQEGGPGMNGSSAGDFRSKCTVISGYGGGTTLYSQTPPVTPSSTSPKHGMASSEGTGAGGSGAAGLSGSSAGTWGGNGASGRVIIEY